MLPRQLRDAWPLIVAWPALFVWPIIVDVRMDLEKITDNIVGVEAACGLPRMNAGGGLFRSARATHVSPTAHVSPTVWRKSPM